jgi:hypothetical protein
MLTNNNALRKVAQQNQIEYQQAKKQSELSLKNSHTATMIANMTMLCLPATFVAVGAFVFLCLQH